MIPFSDTPLERIIEWFLTRLNGFILIRKCTTVLPVVRKLERVVPDPEMQTIPARSGKAAAMKKGQVLKVINTHGEQVVDFWAFNAEDLGEFMSMEHTRSHTLHFIPRVGDILRTNRRRPMLTLIEDTSGGIHDTQMAACDSNRYQFLGCTEYHDNCEDNMHASLAEIRLKSAETPAPFNLFMNIPVDSGGNLSFQPPVCHAGDYVALRAEIDLIVAFSACPQDILPINGTAGKPTEAHFLISDA